MWSGPFMAMHPLDVRGPSMPMSSLGCGGSGGLGNGTKWETRIGSVRSLEPGSPSTSEPMSLSRGSGRQRRRDGLARHNRADSGSRNLEEAVRTHPKRVHHGRTPGRRIGRPADGSVDRRSEKGSGGLPDRPSEPSFIPVLSSVGLYGGGKSPGSGLVSRLGHPAPVRL